MIIKHQRGRGNKIHLFLDDEYAVTTDENFWFDHYIPDGTEISDEEWEKLLEEINYKKALNKCADLLSRRDHSAKELKTKLLRTVDEKSADRAIERYKQAGYLDDYSYCERLVEYLFTVKKYSKSHVKQECFKRGIGSSISNEIIEKYEYDPTDVIVDLINSKYLTKLEAENGRQKVVQALMRKGFSYSDINNALCRFDDE